MRDAGRSARASFVPQAPPPKKEEERPPDLREVVQDPTTRLVLAKLMEASLEIGEAQKSLSKQRDLITDKMKSIASDLGISVVCHGDIRLNYYNAPRSRIVAAKLLSLGVSPAIIEQATVVSDSYTLRISRFGQEESD
jgi:hypothetical protein